jgi:hypothetical protein
MLKVLGTLLMIGLAAALTTQAQTPAASQAPRASAAKIEDAAWLAGRWIGTGLGGELEEVWSPPAGGQMVGHFRLLVEGKPQFYEFMLLDVAEGGIRMRLKHFNPDHTAWEDKETWTTFTPVSSSADELVFSALSIRRRGADAITMKLQLRRGGQAVEETLQFRRAR